MASAPASSANHNGNSRAARQASRAQAGQSRHSGSLASRNASLICVANEVLEKGGIFFISSFHFGAKRRNERKKYLFVLLGGRGCTHAIWHERLPGFYDLLASLRFRAGIVNHCFGTSDFLLLRGLGVDAGLSLLKGVVAGLHQALYLLLAAAGYHPHGIAPV